MSYTGLTQTNPLALPRTIDPAASLAETNSLPPPGRPLDATADLHPARSGHYEAVKHKITVTLTGTYATDDVATFVVTPVTTANGVAGADAFTPVTFDVVTGATQTPTGTAALAPAAALASSTIGSLAEVGSTTRLREICKVTASGATVIFEAVNPGDTFTVEMSHDASGTSTQAITTDADGTDLRIGVFVVRDGMHSDGVTPKVRLPAANDTPAMVYGLVADGPRAIPIDSEAGYSARYYRPGRDVPILPLEGCVTAYAEAAVDYGDEIWIRLTAGASEQAGAANDAPDRTSQVITVTPTAANATNFAGFVQVFDSDGVVVATSPFNYTSDADGTAAEIVTGLSADLTASDVDDYLAITGSATLILTMTEGYTAAFVSTGVGVLAPVVTGNANDHIKLTKGKFARTTSAAGSCAIDFGL